MTHRNLTKFLTLATACLASLCVGAYMSYQAASRQDGSRQDGSSVSVARTEMEAASPSAHNQMASAPIVAAREAAPAEPAPLGALSLEAPSRQVFAPALALRGSAFAPLETSRFEEAMRPSQDAEPLDVAELPPVPEIAAAPAPERSAPLPPVRPASLAAVAPPAPVPAPAAEVAAAPPSAAAGAFPNIANALQAMASVGGSETGLSPENAPATPTPGETLRKGAPVYVRIFKQEGALELWMKRGGAYVLAKSFQICKWSGKLGPKTQAADYQSPEGFYSVSARQLNPHSHYHLAFDVGYPNAYDRRHGATGSAIMVHGDCQSIGCFAMTNRGIEEIYSYVAAALANGQHEVPVHIFPFRMTEEAIARESSGPILAFLGDGTPHRDWSPFWRNLKEGYDVFERSHVPPVAYACGDRYEFGAGGSSCARIAGR